MHIDPVIDAARHYDALHSFSEAVDKAEADLAWDYAMACKQGDVKAVADFAPDVNDYSVKPVNGTYAKRPQTLGDVMFESVDYSNGPSFDDVFAVLLRVANEGDKEAAALVSRMGKKWANMNVGEAYR